MNEALVMQDMFPESIEAADSFPALLGAVAIPFSTLIKADEMVRTLRQSDVAGLFVQRTLLGYDLVDRLCDALPALRETSDPELRLARTPYLRWIISSGPSLPATIREA